MVANNAEEYFFPINDTGTGTTLLREHKYGIKNTKKMIRRSGSDDPDQRQAAQQFYKIKHSANSLLCTILEAAASSVPYCTVNYTVIVFSNFMYL